MSTDLAPQVNVRDPLVPLRLDTPIDLTEEGELDAWSRCFRVPTDTLLDTIEQVGTRLGDVLRALRLQTSRSN